MQLVEEGLMDLDEPAYHYLPKIKEVKVIDGISSDPPQLLLKDQEQPITVRQLLNHTAGFGYQFSDPLLDEAYKEGLIPEATDGDPHPIRLCHLAVNLGKHGLMVRVRVGWVCSLKRFVLKV